jgi:hypothetical protein
MKNLINNVLLVAAFAILLASCKPELAIPTPTKGSLNLTSYVAIGNSLTSGYQNGGLSYSGQQSSFVNVLAEQFKLVQPDLVFNTPYVSASSVGCAGPELALDPPFDGVNLANNLGKTFTITITVPSPLSLQTVTDCKGVSGLSPVAGVGDGQIILGPGYNNQTGATYTWGPLTFPTPPPFPTIPTAPSIYAGTGFNNMGVPGAKAIDINRKGYGGENLVTISGTTAMQSNPFFSRFAKDKTNSSILSDAMLMNPTFFTLFIGNNDVLLWALGGGDTCFGAPTITPLADFSDSIDVIVNTLTTSAQQGVIINIPQITGSAYFMFQAPDVTKYIIDENAVTRLMTTSDMMLLSVPGDSLECGLDGFGTMSHPIPKKYTLTANQITQATNTIDAYNAKLKAVADAKGLAFFDMNAFVKTNQAGTEYNGMKITGTFVTGGTFSLDGLHLTARGYGALANELIVVINTKYGSTLPGVDLTKLSGVTFPQ